MGDLEREAVLEIIGLLLVLAKPGVIGSWRVCSSLGVVEAVTLPRLGVLVVERFRFFTLLALLVEGGRRRLRVADALDIMLFYDIVMSC